MTPNEKARELYDEFYQQAMHALSIEIRKHVAKQCALIAVDEIIKSNPSTYDLDVSSFMTDMDTWTIKNIKFNIVYWEEVKQEIENYKIK